MDNLSALSAVIQMVLLSLPYTLQSPTGTRHSIHLTHRSCNWAGATATAFILYECWVRGHSAQRMERCGCLIKLRLLRAELHSNQTQNNKTFCLLNVFNIVMFYSKNIWLVAKTLIHQRLVLIVIDFAFIHWKWKKIMMKKTDWMNVWLKYNQMTWSATFELVSLRLRLGVRSGCGCKGSVLK